MLSVFVRGCPVPGTHFSSVYPASSTPKPVSVGCGDFYKKARRDADTVLLEIFP